MYTLKIFYVLLISSWTDKDRKLQLLNLLSNFQISMNQFCMILLAMVEQDFEKANNKIQQLAVEKLVYLPCSLVLIRWTI